MAKKATAPEVNDVTADIVTAEAVLIPNHAFADVTPTDIMTAEDLREKIARLNDGTRDRREIDESTARALDDIEQTTKRLQADGADAMGSLRGGPSALRIEEFDHLRARIVSGAASFVAGFTATESRDVGGRTITLPAIRSDFAREALAVAGGEVVGWLSDYCVRRRQQIASDEQHVSHGASVLDELRRVPMLAGLIAVAKFGMAATRTIPGAVVPFYVTKNAFSTLEMLIETQSGLPEEARLPIPTNVSVNAVREALTREFESETRGGTSAVA